MRAVFGVVALLVALAIVGMLAVKQLKATYLFKDLPDAALRKIADGAEPQTAQPGEVVVQESRASDALFVIRSASVMASAAAVASSSIEALVIAMPVRSQIIVWKLSSPSRRPCEISG